MEKDEALWTAKDVSKYLQLSMKTIYRKAADGEIPSVTIGKNLRFKPDEIKKLAQEYLNRPDIGDWEKKWALDWEKKYGYFSDPEIERILKVGRYAEKTNGNG